RSARPVSRHRDSVNLLAAAGGRGLQTRGQGVPQHNRINTMDLLMASGIFALVFVGVLILTSRRGTGVEQQREVARRLTRPPTIWRSMSCASAGPSRDRCWACCTN